MAASTNVRASLRQVTELVKDLSKLESFDTAARLAEDLQCDRPLETAAARKKRKEAEADDVWTVCDAANFNKNLCKWTGL